MDDDGILRYLFHAQQSQYTTMAALTLVVHDHLFTCRQEYKFIWIRKWSISKVVFFVSRYGTLAVLIFDIYVQLNGGSSDSFCADWFCFQAWTGFASTFITELVLLFRLYAMYHGSRNWTYILSTLFAGQLGVMAFVLAQGCRTTTATSEPLPGVHTCMALTTLSYEYVYWIATLTFEALLFILALRKARENIRQYNFTFNDVLVSQRVAQVLIRDGLMYFPFIFLTYLINLILWSISPAYLGQVANHAALAVRSVLTNRLLLNVSRKFYYPQNGGGEPDTVIGFVAYATPPEERDGRLGAQVHITSVRDMRRERDEDEGRREVQVRTWPGKGKARAEEDSDEEGLVELGGDEDRRLSVPFSAGSSRGSPRLDPLGVVEQYGMAL